MLTTARSFLASHRDSSERVGQGQKFAVQLPLVGRVALPPPDQLAFYGVVGGLAALGMIDWPVAVAIGVGQAIVVRHLDDHASTAREPQRLEAGDAETAAKKAAPRKTAARKATGTTRKAAKPRSTGEQA